MIHSDPPRFTHAEMLAISDASNAGRIGSRQFGPASFAVLTALAITRTPTDASVVES
jgi:hypothetical protein